MTKTQRYTIFVLLFLGLLGALHAAWLRVKAERANRTVGLCLDDLEVRQLAALTGQTPLALLRQFRQAGTTHLAVSEQTLGELLQTGLLRLEPTKNGMTLWGARKLVAEVAQRLKGTGVLCGSLEARPGNEACLPVPSIIGAMTKLGVRYDPEAVRLGRQAGLRIVARPMPDYLLTPQALRASLQAARRLGARIVLFNGVTVGGGTQLAAQTAALLRSLGLQFGFVEIVPQEGATALAAALDYQIIRTHSISQDEMLKTSAWRGLDRFTLAVTERNVRLCYVRLLLIPQPDIRAANVDYVRSLQQALIASGYVMGEPQGFTPLHVRRFVLLLLGLGVVGGGLWLWQELFAGLPCYFWGWAALGGAAAVGGTLAPGWGQAFFPLAAAIIFPSLAILHAASAAARAGACAQLSSSPAAPAEATTCAAPDGYCSLRRAGWLIGRAWLLTALGGLMLAGFLSSTAYMMQIAQFRGVKFAQLLPLMIVLAAMIGRLYGGETGSGTSAPQAADGQATGAWPQLRRGLLRAAEAPVKYWHSAAFLIVLGALAFMIMRSGNESAVSVPTFELKLRAWLDRLLLVRPRTKEVFFGYPALWLGLTLLCEGRQRTAWAWLSLGTIAFISMTNTFCHLHTPLLISLLRVFHGLWVGLIVGMIWQAAKKIGDRLLHRLAPRDEECAFS